VDMIRRIFFALRLRTYRQSPNELSSLFPMLHLRFPFCPHVSPIIIGPRTPKTRESYIRHSRSSNSCFLFTSVQPPPTMQTIKKTLGMNPLETRQLGKDGPQVTALGFGCMGLYVLLLLPF